MIQIKSTSTRKLDDLCEAHYNKLQSYIISKASSLKPRQKTFIVTNLKRIITSKPNELTKIHQDFITDCTAPGINKLLPKNVNKGLHSVFNYNWFSKKTTTPYCAYDLAKVLKVNTCPYCNRNYTVTVIREKSKITRPDFDHFFPKKQYPLLALSFFNLIPSCSICNRTVKNQAKIVYGKYVHPYEEGFGNALKINFFPKDVDSSVGMKANYEIVPLLNPLEPIKTKMCLASFKLFQLKDIYVESHNDEISEIIRKHHISNGRYLEMLKAAFPQIGDIDELYRLAFGNFYMEEHLERRPLSKLTKDVVDQLVFTIPGKTLISK